MQETLRMAGVEDRVLQMVPDVVNTCRECRAWARPAEDTQSTYKVATRFNH